MFKNYVCPNGLPAAECAHIPQLLKNAEGFLTKLVARLNAKTATQAPEEHGVRTWTTQVKKVQKSQDSAPQPERYRARGR